MFVFDIKDATLSLSSARFLLSFFLENLGLSF